MGIGSYLGGHTKIFISEGGTKWRYPTAQLTGQTARYATNRDGEVGR